MNKTLFKSIREYRKQSILAPVLVILEVLMEVLIPLEMAKIIDVGIANGDLGPLAAFLQHNDRGIHRIFGDHVIVGTGAFAHAHAVPIGAGNGGVAVGARGISYRARTHQGRKPKRQRHDQQYGNNPFHVEIPPLHNVCEVSVPG